LDPEEGLIMEETNPMQVYQPGRLYPAVSGNGTGGAIHNVRFSLNLANPHMRRLTWEIGFHDFDEMVETYYTMTKISHDDIEGHLELLCNILFDKWSYLEAMSNELGNQKN
jgi:hypothetical protein